MTCTRSHGSCRIRFSQLTKASHDHNWEPDGQFWAKSEVADVGLVSALGKFWRSPQWCSWPDSRIIDCLLGNRPILIVLAHTSSYQICSEYELPRKGALGNKPITKTTQRLDPWLVGYQKEQYTSGPTNNTSQPPPRLHNPSMSQLDLKMPKQRQRWFSDSLSEPEWRSIIGEIKLWQGNLRSYWFGT